MAHNIMAMIFVAASVATAATPPNSTFPMPAASNFPAVSMLADAAAMRLSAPIPVPAPATPPSVADAAFARKLIKDSTWGVVSSINTTETTNPVPFGNVLSFSDGGSGFPFFYLTKFDRATAVFAEANPRASLAVSQYGGARGCGEADPQEPPCARVTLSGNLQKVAPETEEGMLGRGALLAAHPRFNQLPAVANFELYKLNVTGDVFLINSYFNSPKFIPVPLYLSAHQ